MTKLFFSCPFLYQYIFLLTTKWGFFYWHVATKLFHWHVFLLTSTVILVRQDFTDTFLLMTEPFIFFLPCFYWLYVFIDNPVGGVVCFFYWCMFLPATRLFTDAFSIEICFPGNHSFLLTGVFTSSLTLILPGGYNDTCFYWETLLLTYFYQFTLVLYWQVVVLACVLTERCSCWRVLPTTLVLHGWVVLMTCFYWHTFLPTALILYGQVVLTRFHWHIFYWHVFLLTTLVLCCQVVLLKSL